MVQKFIYYFSPDKITASHKNEFKINICNFQKLRENNNYNNKVEYTHT